MPATMPIEMNATHDPARRSWVASANASGTDFPIQNLPFGLFRANGLVRGGVALGECIIDLAQINAKGLLSGGAAEAAEGATGDRSELTSALVPIADAELLMPMKPAAFTDFCTSYDHIRRMGGTTPKLAALSLPVAYNGRASSVRASGTPVVRPCGQFEAPPGSNDVKFGPEPFLDFELEFGAWLRGGNPLGETISVAEAEDLLFGCCLVNDWSARGIQFFESILGPHLGKSFLTTISPWIVTVEALAPFRVAARGRTSNEPDVPAYLLDPADRQLGGINVELTADLANNAGSAKRIVRSGLAELFWTLAQMVAHQASNGAPLETGDLVATGTVSGAGEEARGCLAEITLRGGETITLPDGSTRKQLEDGDTLTIRGRALAEGFVPIGFGDCSGTIQPARLAA